MWRELAKERIDAAQVILHIATAPNMPQNVRSTVGAFAEVRVYACLLAPKTE